MPKTSGSFKKGDPRINRKGRPKKGNSVGERFFDALNEVLDPATGYTVFDSMLDAHVKKAMQGNQDAFEYLINRAFGKMIERIETNNTNKNYDFTNLSMEERLQVLQAIKNADTTVRSDNPDTD